MHNGKEEVMGRFDGLEQKLGVKFNNRALLFRAMTHASFVNENWDHHGHNECLAFLGSSVLETVVTERLISGAEKIGDIAKHRDAIVNAGALFSIGTGLGLFGSIQMSKGALETFRGHPSESLIANAVRAIVGALYLDQGIGACGTFVERHILSRQEEILEAFRNYKTELQEKTDALFGVSPTYRFVEDRGPDHDKTHIVEVLVGDRIWGRGEGKSRKHAETAAAGNALANLEDQTNESGRLSRRIVVTV